MRWSLLRDQQGFLDEAWRCLRGSGELVLIVPHRRGFWARSDKTPFGGGVPLVADRYAASLTSRI